MRHARNFERADLPGLLTFLGALAAERWPAPSLLMNSDLAWQLPGSGPKDNLRLWFDDDVLRAFAWFQPPGHLHFDAWPGHEYLLEAALAWAHDRRRAFPADEPFHLALESMEQWADVVRSLADRPPATARCLVVQALEGDAAREALLRAQGFEPTDHHEPFLTLEFAKAPPRAATPAGFTVRAVREAEFGARIAAHRAAWAPSTGFDAAFYGRVRALAPPQ